MSRKLPKSGPKWMKQGVAKVAALPELNYRAAARRRILDSRPRNMAPEPRRPVYKSEPLKPRKKLDMTRVGEPALRLWRP